MLSAPDTPSTRPYLIRALYEWCTDNALTPYVAVLVDDSVQVPREHVKDGEIVLNISFDATSALKLGNEHIEFKARFGGVAREIMVPVSRVLAIYARENGQGMTFSVPVPGTADSEMPPAGRGSVLSRLLAAGSSTSTAAESRIVQLVPIEGTATADERPGESEPPDRPHGGGRPALKRVK